MVQTALATSVVVQTAVITAPQRGSVPPKPFPTQAPSGGASGYVPPAAVRNRRREMADMALLPRLLQELNQITPLLRREGVQQFLGHE